jgi:hypothetical protein
MTTMRAWMLSVAVCFAGCAAGEETEETDPYAEQPACGDGVCDSDESCDSCSTDCGECEESFCGDGACDVAAGECEYCPEDCAPACGPAICGDGICDGDETCADCPDDCGQCPAVCGNGDCEPTEDCASCEADCGACDSECGDGTCAPDEDCTSCEEDCGPCGPVCGDGVCEAPEDCASCEVDCGPCGGTCAHSPCEQGGPLAEDCDPCVTTVCNLDFYCCLVEWDVSCVNAAYSPCSDIC